MKFKNWIKLITESMKDNELNRILDKISSGIKLSKMEQSFLDRYSDISDDDLSNNSHLSLLSAYDRISNLLNKKKRVVCDLNSNYGIILSLNRYDDEYYIILKGGKKILMKDSFLYNITYNFNDDEYLIEIQDEYYEKIPIDNDNI